MRSNTSESLHIKFDREFRVALINNQEVKLTRRERDLCRVLSAHPGRIYTRDQLLVSLAEEDSETFDRNIDNVVSRLRRKLGDSAKDPKIIETIYGEGYRWVLQPEVERTEFSPLASFTQILNLSNTDIPFSWWQHVQSTLIKSVNGKRSSASTNIIYNPENNTKINSPTDARARIDIEMLVSDIHERPCLTINIIDRGSNFSEFITDNPVAIDRISKKYLSTLSEKLKSTLIAFELNFLKTEQGNACAPITTRLFDISKRFGSNEATHSAAYKELVKITTAQPEDYKSKVALAVCIQNQMTLGMIENRTFRESKILNLALEAAPHLLDSPRHLAACAEIIFRYGDQYSGLQYAETALQRGTHTASSLMVFGKLSAYKGEFDQAHRCYDQAISLIESPSTFYQMLITLKAIAFMAENKVDDLNRTLKEIIDLEPFSIKRAIIRFGFHHVDDPIPFAMKIMLRGLPKRIANKLLFMVFNNGARFFVLEKHRANLIRAQVKALVEIHGTTIVDDKIRNSIPSLF